MTDIPLILETAKRLDELSVQWEKDFAGFAGGAKPGEGDVLPEFENDYGEAKDTLGWTLVEMLNETRRALHEALSVAQANTLTWEQMLGIVAEGPVGWRRAWADMQYVKATFVASGQYTTADADRFDLILETGDGDEIGPYTPTEEDKAANDWQTVI